MLRDNQRLNQDLNQFVVDFSKAKVQDRAEVLVQAVNDSDVTEIRLLLENGFDPNAYNDNHETALMWAAKLGKLVVVQLLLAYGAQVDAVDEFGDSALMMAAEKGHLHIVQLLLTYEARPNIKNVLGETAFVIAKVSGHAEIARLLDHTYQFNLPESVSSEYRKPSSSANFGSFNTIMGLLAN